LEKAVDLSSDRLLIMMMMMMIRNVHAGNVLHSKDGGMTLTRYTTACIPVDTAAFTKEFLIFMTVKT
jgi:hypothetical protein